MNRARPLSEGNRLQRAYDRWAQPHYARMEPAVREQAELMDRFLYSRRGLGVWLGMAGSVAGTTLGLRHAGLSTTSALTLALAIWVALPMSLLAAWLVPAKFAGPTLRRKLPLILAMALLGGLAGFVVGHVGKYGSLDFARLLDALWRGAAVLVPAVLAGAAGFMFLTWGVAQTRRQMLERAFERERLARERDTAARHAAEARLKLLQAQIQPHFIFNTLSAAQHWVDSGDARGGPLLRSLTAFLRGSTEALGRDEVTLAEEAAMVRHYLAIMQARLGGRLQSVVDIAPEIADERLPPGLLLTLVENAVEHGIAPSLAGGIVTVDARTDGDAGQLTVSDSAGALPAAWAEGVGIANCRERLRQRFGEAAALTVQLDAQGATVATLRWPLQGLGAA
jgi:hypothetical protein